MTALLIDKALGEAVVGHVDFVCCWSCRVAAV